MIKAIKITVLRMVDPAEWQFGLLGQMKGIVDEQGNAELPVVGHTVFVNFDQAVTAPATGWKFEPGDEVVIVLKDVDSEALAADPMALIGRHITAAGLVQAEGRPNGQR